MIVMKFGGTSVEDSRAIERLEKIARQRSGEKPVIVVSAMSKVTDQLLATARKAGDSDVTGALDSARGLRERHYAAAGELLGTGADPPDEFWSNIGRAGMIFSLIGNCPGLFRAL